MQTETGKDIDGEREIKIGKRGWETDRGKFYIGIQKEGDRERLK
jgi:hypothetical protein